MPGNARPVEPPVPVTPFPGTRHDHERCVDQALLRAEAVCGERGARLTMLRRRVLELVWRSHRPVKAYDLLELLREERAGAAPPTVYRALEFLLEMRLIHRIESLNAFLGCGDPAHPHAGQFLICTHCQAVAELNDPALSEAMKERAEGLGFRLDSQVVELAGICPRCREGANGP